MSVARQYPTTTGPVETTTAPVAPVETTASRPRLVPAQGVIATRPAIPVSVILLGLVALLVAAWGAAAPYAGPEFGFVADRAVAWQWSVTSACLALGPGALAFLASLIVVAAATRASYARRADLWILGLVVTLCGAWFVVGQYVWPVIYGKLFIAPSNANHFMWKELAFAIGPGVILVFCGAVFMGWAARRQLALVADRYPRTGSVVEGGVVAGTTAVPRIVGPTIGNTGTMAPPVTTRPVVTTANGATGAVVHPTGTVVNATGTVAHPTGVVEGATGTVAHPTGTVVGATGTVAHPTGAVERPTGIVEERTPTIVRRAPGEVAPPA